MLRRFWCEFLDELTANVLLHFCFRYRQRPVVHGPTMDEAPQLYCGDLQPFFGEPPAVVDWSSLGTAVGEKPSQRVWDLAFPSDTHTRWPENNVVRARQWQTTERDQGLTIVGVHGIVQFGTRWFRQLADQLNPRGIDLVMMDAPLNFRRTPRGYRPGQLIMGGDLGHQLQTTRQGVRDLWRIVRSLQQQGRQVGLIGVSYGGWLSLLTSLVAEDLRSLTAITPPVDTLRILKEGGTMVRALRRGLGTQTLDFATLSQQARVCRPNAWPCKMPGDRITLHMARHDRFVPSHHIVELAQAWNTRLVTHDIGHYQITTSHVYLPNLADELIAPKHD